MRALKEHPFNFLMFSDNVTYEAFWYFCPTVNSMGFAGRQHQCCATQLGGCFGEELCPLCLSRASSGDKPPIDHLDGDLDTAQDD